ncbi:Pseudouridine kinase [Sarcoptes scabiei]|uniref:Carbohydrate kinase PfkB domain-containing protein n=1 Tax=Sarcoptes scabiei TaxID=52283 RepID=A0A834VE83_SARSC|nr:Pseudouridine kinase [Sarcoptes scabiei]
MEREKLNGSTYDGTVHTSFGGVGRNIADSINRLGTDCLLITAVGHDLQGRMIAESISKKFRVKNPYDYNKITKIDKLSTIRESETEGVQFVSNQSTSSCLVLLDEQGDCRLIVGDLIVNQSIDRSLIMKYESEIVRAPIIIIDANLPMETLNLILKLAGEHKIPSK